MFLGKFVFIDLSILFGCSIIIEQISKLSIQIEISKVQKKSLMKKLIKFIKFQKKTNKRFSNRGKLYKIVIKEKLCIYFKNNIF